MELKGIPPEKSSFALTLLSFMECVTYIIASFVGDWFKGNTSGFHSYFNTVFVCPWTPHSEDLMDLPAISDLSHHNSPEFRYDISGHSTIDGF